MYLGDELCELSHHEMYPYRRAKLIIFENDLSKDWYVEFYVWHIKEKKLKRRRVKKGINRLRSISGRVTYGKKMAREINELLGNGSVMGKDDQLQKSNLKRFTMLEAIELVLDFKKEEKLRPSTVKNYGTLKTSFQAFADDFGYVNLLTSQFNQDIAKEFLNWIIKQGLTARTRNNLLSILKMVVKHLSNLDNTFWKANPCAFINKLPTQSSKHTAYTKTQIEQIKEAILEKDDHQLLLFIQFIFYCFSRPGTETRFMKIEHLEKERLYIPAANSKNRKGDWVSIPRAFQKEMEKLNSNQYPGHYFVFMANGVPGLVPLGKNYFYKRFKKILN